MGFGICSYENSDFHLVGIGGIDWSRVVMFQLDEYIGLPQEHPASFRRFLREHFIAKIPPLKETFFIHGDAEDPGEECRRLNRIIPKYPID